jgi:hypothetical protein
VSDVSISGSPVVGGALEADATVSGTPTPTLTYQWERCNASGGSCDAILGATGVRYTLVAADAGGTVRVVVRAANGTTPDDAATSAVSGRIPNPSVPNPSIPARLTGTPTISGTILVGQVLRAAASATGTPVPTVAYQWQRCDAAGGSCSDLPGATAAQRTLVAGDVGTTLRVVATASNGVGGSDSGRSAATAIVPGLAASGSSTAVFESAPTGPASVVVGAQGTTPSRVPFPQVRIRGKLRRGGALVTLFSVTAPKAWRIDVRCRGRGCPRARLLVTVRRRRATRLRAYERFLRAGIRLSVRVSKKGSVGKYSSLRIRSGAAPRRRDMCLTAKRSIPHRCRS